MPLGLLAAKNTKVGINKSHFCSPFSVTISSESLGCFGSLNGGSPTLRDGVAFIYSIHGLPSAALYPAVACPSHVSYGSGVGVGVLKAEALI